MRILIANRGEIARRIIRTAHRLGHETVAVYADPDAGAPHTKEATVAIGIGPADLSSSYLSADVILDAAARTSVQAIHPGYGFLSENADFARAVTDAGLIWIGPHADAIATMGSKIEARRIAGQAGVPVVPGYDADQDPARLRAAAGRISYPVLVKASAGGGGKGIRIVDSPDAFDSALAEARAEAQHSFGDDRVIVERYVSRPRHVEVQVVGDRLGHVLDLGTRECSVQRRYQKLMEEAPAPNLPDATRTGLREAAVALASAIGYDSAGTVEFIVDDDSGDFFFLEMNTRLQVEHPVTELVTGLDLVELQIGVALGEPLPGGPIPVEGHAFEVRINAEDAWAGFVPQTGVVTDLVLPDGVRWDSGVEAGSAITPYYDPMIAKLIVGGPDRETARRRLARALDGLLIGGVTTNAGFHRWLVDQPPVVDGRVTTRFLDETSLPPPPDEAQAASVAALHWIAARDAARGDGPWQRLTGFRLTPHRGPRRVFLEGPAGTHDVEVDERPAKGLHRVDLAARSVAVSRHGHTHTFRILSRAERWAPVLGGGHGHADAVTAPFPGVVSEVRVKPGDEVASGETVAVLEAMKMLHPLTAAGSGVVAEVRVAAGDQVASGQVLVTFEPRPRTENGDSE